MEGTRKEKKEWEKKIRNIEHVQKEKRKTKCQRPHSEKHVSCARCKKYQNLSDFPSNLENKTNHNNIYWAEYVIKLAQK